MNHAQLSSLSRDLLGLAPAPKKHIPAYDTECTVSMLGVEWLAGVSFDCDGDAEASQVEVDSVAICSATDEPHKRHWIDVEFTELPESAIEAIEEACGLHYHDCVRSGGDEDYGCDR